VIRYREIRPSARLQPFIASLWILELDGQDAPQRIVPDGHAELILNWSNPLESFHAGQWHTQPRHFLAGQIDGPLLLRPKGPAKMIGIGFHPHGAARIFRTPMPEVSGRFTPVEDLSTPLARELVQALDAPNPIAAVEAALAPVRDSDMLIQEAVRRIDLGHGACDLAVLCRDLGLSTRQFERRFHTAVGLRPKLFCRIRRFRNVFRVLGEPSGDWARTAIDCGYYDQSHLIRDCKSFSGATPATLMADDADLARHFYLRFGVSHLSNTTCRRSL
jgi:AraC-like DNA-binding protein